MISADEFIDRKLQGVKPEWHDACWDGRSFLEQLMDVWPEAYRLDACQSEDDIQRQWEVLDSFCNKMYACEDNLDSEKETLALAQHDLYRYFIVKDSSLSKNGAFSWWKQWRYDVNFALAYGF